jgi:cytidine deaminase
MTNKELISKAIDAMQNSYSPYSKFKVGAALLTVDEEVYTGCNVENASYSMTVCAERTAFFKAVSEGKRNFSKIAIIAGRNGIISDYTSPCGACLQVIREFSDDYFEIILAKSTDDYKVFKLSELLPHSFSNQNLGD